jgi:hypothetical protein
MPPDTDVSAITVHVDALLEARGMTLTELADRVDLTLGQPLDPQDRKGPGHPIHHAGCAVRRAAMPAG